MEGRRMSGHRKNPAPRIIVTARLTDRELARAACTQTDPEVFFPINDTSQAAKQVCARCPLVATHLGGDGRCLDVALQNRERFGIFGGLTETERARIGRKKEA